MSLSLHPEKLRRYHRVLKFLFKYGGTFDSAADLEETRLRQQEDDREEVHGPPEEFVSELEKLGPTFVKLGQFLSTRPDFLPHAYVAALARLQDGVTPIPFEEVETVVQNELGARISKAFETLESEPAASASLGQVHFARLRDGRPVAVKVQRPGVREQVLKDLEALEDLARAAQERTEAGRRYGVRDMLGEFRKALLRELDYEVEARNLTRLHRQLEGHPDLIVPLPVLDYTTPRVLTMDYVQGTKVTNMSPLRRLELDGRRLAESLCKAYLDQILIHGFFHADPHPGNVFLTDDNRIALIDLGMAVHIDPMIREQLMKLLFLVSEGRGRETVDLSIKLGRPMVDADLERFRREGARLVLECQSESLSTIATGRVFLEMVKISSQCGVRPAMELAVIGKALLNLDEAARTLDPRFDPNAFIRREAGTLMQRHLVNTLSPGSLFGSLLETQDLIRRLPGRVSDILDMVSRRDLEIRVRAFDEATLMRNLQKIANRIATGLILAALVVGAAMMMRVETEFTIFGYPGVAMLLFLGAAFLGFGLVITILLKDAKHRRPPEP